MNNRRLTTLTLVVATAFLGNACSKANLGVPPVPTVTLIGKQGYDARPLYFVDSVEVNDFRQAKFSPADIDHINVVSPPETKELISRYGERGKNGAIFVTTKKGSKALPS